MRKRITSTRTLQKLSGQQTGASFQSVIDLVNAHYFQIGRACITRKAIPGKYLSGRRFVPESKAEPDYGGTIAPTGRAIFYDAKTTQKDRLDLANLHPHQISFLQQMAAMGAVSGFLVEFASFRKVFFLPIQIVTFYLSSQKRKSIPFRFCEEALVVVEAGKGMLIFDYLTAIETQEKRFRFE